MTAATADVLARIVRAREALEDGDEPLARAILADLEAHLAEEPS